MIRTNIYSRQSKMQHKKQVSQEPRGQRSRKNNSPSPVYKEININKENIHPNLNKELGHLNLNLEQQPYRQAYYLIKQQNLLSKLDQNKLVIPSGESPLCSRNSRPKELKEIQIKLTNKSLEKCQIHPIFQPSPKAQYLLHYQKHVDVLTCEQCSRGWNHCSKGNLDKLTNSLIGNGFTVKQYYSVLSKKIQELEKAKLNMEGWEKGWRQMSVQQTNKMRKHYNDILEIIENSMKESENQLASHVSEGEKVLTNKKEEIQDQLNKTRGELRKLLNFQEKQLTFQLGTNMPQASFDFDCSVIKLDLQIKLPVMHIYTQVPNLKQEFQKIFKTGFGLQPLTNSELEQREQQKQRQQQKQQQQKIQNTHMSPHCQQQSYNRNSTARQEEESDLFCEESLGESKSNKTKQFSFEKSNESSIVLGRNTDCIMELVEEEDVISPVFKAI